MKFYIATRFSIDKLRNKAAEIKTELESLGHQMTLDWTTDENLRPYNKNQEKAKDFSEREIQAVLDADFLYFSPAQMVLVCM